MSGHSHWDTIKRKKEATDHKRGQVFSKLAKAISVAAKDGADPDSNFKLRLLMDKARQFNMPKENVARAIQKGSGQAGDTGLVETVYEGYGPEGIAVIVEAVTDNRNRTTAEIKNIFEKNGGALASPGAVSFQFRKKSWFLVEKKVPIEDQLLKMIDLGVDDVNEIEEGIEVYSVPEDLKLIKSALEEATFKVKEMEIINQPITPLTLAEKGSLAKVTVFLENLESQDDVQKVYTNLAP